MKHTIVTVCAVLMLLTGGTAWANSAPDNEEEVKGASGLPLPRFASLRANEVNLRTGPGTRYPIEWVFVRQGLPVEITAEFDIWRRVRDWEGSEGWVHKSALTGKRTVIVTAATSALHKDESPDAAIEAKVEAGAIGQLLSCSPLWCKVRFDKIKGYIPREDIWGLYKNETIE